MDIVKNKTRTQYDAYIPKSSETEALHLFFFEEKPTANVHLSHYFQEKGHHVQSIAHTNELESMLALSPVDMIIVDGVHLTPSYLKEVVKRIRHDFPRVGILVLSAEVEPAVRIEGYKTGIDMYLPKTIDPAELDAIVQRLIQRLVAQVNAGIRSLMSTTLPYATNKKSIWKFQKQRWLLTAPNGEKMTLSAREQEFLLILINAKGKIVSKKDVTEQLFGESNEHTNGRLDVLLTRLRKKAQKELGEILPVKTVHAVGYAFTALYNVSMAM